MRAATGSRTNWVASARTALNAVRAVGSTCLRRRATTRGRGLARRGCGSGSTTEKPDGTNNMGKPFKIDLEGMVFGTLTIVRYHGKDANNKTMWECNCSCGSVGVLMQGYHLTSGATRRCWQCRSFNKKHGDASYQRSPEYCVTQCLSAWAEETGVKAAVIRKRIESGWPLHEALL